MSHEIPGFKIPLTVRFDNLTNLDGPAIENGWGRKRFFVHGVEYDELNYWDHPDVIKFQNMKKLKKAFGL